MNKTKIDWATMSWNPVTGCRHGCPYRTMQDLEEMSCVPREDLLKYAKGRRLSGWIVQSPEKFDAPSPLAESGLDRPPMSWQYVEIPDAAEE